VSKEKRLRVRKDGTFLPSTYKAIMARAKMHGRSFNGELNAIVNEALKREQEETPRNTPKRYIQKK
jgi:plasmid stability protein